MRKNLPLNSMLGIGWTFGLKAIKRRNLKNSSHLERAASAKLAHAGKRLFKTTGY